MIFKLRPILKHRVWGGSRLPKIYNIKTTDSIGEAWILSCINNENNFVNTKKTLKDLFLENKDIVAKGWKGNFPILIKLIDAKTDLSIQVHPKAKTEFWHILNKNKSRLYMGFNKNTSSKQVKESLKDSSVCDLLNDVEVTNNCSYLIKPGTVHAIRKNTFLIEIQQSADVTYRMYDYDRIDSDGKKRPLHIKESLACLNYKKLDVKQHKTTTCLVSCPFFKVYKYKINKTKNFNATSKSFNSIVVLSGKGQIISKDKTINIKEYDSLFIPASSGKYTIKGNLSVVLTTL